jgi:dolichol kinase
LRILKGRDFNMSGGIMEGLMTIVLSMPVLIGSVIILFVSVFLLIVRSKSMKKETRLLLIILAIATGALVSFLFFLVSTFGSNHPPAPPTPTMGMQII